MFISVINEINIRICKKKKETTINILFSIIFNFNI